MYLAILCCETGMFLPDEFAQGTIDSNLFLLEKLFSHFQPRNLSWNSVTIQRFNANIHIFPTNLINIPLLNIFIFESKFDAVEKKKRD